MTNKPDQLDELSEKLKTLLKRQEVFSKEVNEIREEIIQLKISETIKHQEKGESFNEEPVKEQPKYSPSSVSKKLYRDVDHRIIGGVCSGLADYLGINRVLVRILWLFLTLFFGIGFLAYLILWIAIPKAGTTSTSQKPQPATGTERPVNTAPSTRSMPKVSIDLEKFIGENLINKIGIAILILGVAIGTKYTIEHDLISPLTRVILGYLVGLGLLGFGLKLKEKYENFSAVLVSGAMAILYFMTYAAYSFYGLFPQTITFIFMVIFTVFTVIAALNYNKQIIALIGLVGAYAVPFLLSEDPENVAVLFTYMAIINIGILVIAFKKYWKLLYFSSFVLTWLIFASWYPSKYEMAEHFELALTFIFIFFATFYATFLAFKLLQKEKFEITDILLLLFNSFIFYGFGYAILDGHEIGSQLLGLFTLGNGILHFIVGLIIYRQKLGDKNLFYFVAGLVLVFITIAIPVQLDGNWVTLLWVGEAALLFWIGRTKNIPVYENISYPLMALALISIFQDWSTGYNLNFYNNSEEKIIPLLNIHFLSSVLFIAAFGFITFLNNNKKYPSALISQKELLKIVSFAIPAMLLGTLYFALRVEIENYWNQLYTDSNIAINDSLGQYQQNFNYDLLKFKTIWILNYSLLFLSVFSFVNIKKLKNRQFGLFNLGFNTFAILVFLTQGLYILSELRESYLEQTLAIYYKVGNFNIGIRYVSFAFFALAIIACYNYIRQEFMKVDYKREFDLLLHISIIWIASSELINVMDLSGSSESHKLGLSILWGIYSLLLIILGIWKNKKHLRIGAIGLFGITLIKLFFYDISYLDTISKTIIFLSLGILLLIISFLYNKFKHLIIDEIES
jgi:phage shock protein PspC (stress-responsive transcriptional regulator)